MTTLSCGHDTEHGCERCLVCKRCLQDYREEAVASRARADKLILMLESAQRAPNGQASAPVEHDARVAIEREERKLAVVRAAIFYRRIENILKTEEMSDTLRGSLMQLLNDDGQSRTKPIEQLLAEVGS